MHSQRRLLALIGPTAVGKTAVALALARELDGEIISGDSQQVYRGFDIGTAKPTPAERAAVPHHLVDIKDPDEDFSVAEFQARVDELVMAIGARGRLPIMVGGTGLYFRAVLREYTFAELETDGSVRARLAAEAALRGTQSLHARLAEVDPTAAARIHVNDRLRIVRALEVYALTGQPISQLQGEGRQRYDALVVGLTLSREELYARINRRVDAMVAAGWVDEVQGLLARGCSPSRAPMAAIGYREMASYLRGLATWDEAVTWAKRNTRRYAKRQVTWFKREAGVHWVDMGLGTEAAVAAIVRLAAGKWGPK